MSQPDPVLDPWTLVWGQPYIDSRSLAAAIEEDLRHHLEPDFRTRLLVRDAVVALRSYWGARRFGRWTASSPAGRRVRAILKEDLRRPGFATIRRRLVDSIDPPQVRQIFDLLSHEIHSPVEVHIAGSIPTLIKGLTSRPTLDIDFVDEVPAEIRDQQAVLELIKAEFRLTLGDVQPHDLPARWRNRRKWFGDFGALRVYVVDEYDIFVSKLSSKLKKHQLDLRVLALKLDRETARQRLLIDGRAFLDDPKLKPQIEENWRFIFQEELVGERPAKARPEPSRAAENSERTSTSKGRAPRSRRKKRG
jgi:hypothetical protein